jgi:two-component system invasion response regulator UvrY
MALRELLLAHRFRVVAETACASEAVRLCAHHCPDLALLDVSLAVQGEPSTMRTIRNQCPQALLLLLDAAPSTSRQVEAFRAGAVGYLNKRIAPEQVLAAVALAVRGLFVCCLPLSPLAPSR